MINGRRHGDLADRIANDIKKRRRMEAGIDEPPFNPMNLPSSTLAAKRQRELEGGVVVVGRPAFKEYMAGLKRGWTESLELVDKEERLARVLQEDGKFDEVEPERTEVELGEGEPLPTQSKLAPSQPMSAFTAPHFKQPTQPSPTSQSDGGAIPAALNTPPATIPPQPPVLFVPFLNRIGLTQIPMMIWDLFHERENVQSGAEAAYKLIVGETQPMSAPLASSHEFVDPEPTPADPHSPDSHPSDLDFDKEKEDYYKQSIVKAFKSDIQKARDGYYKELPKKLETARALARGTREPTSDEKSYAPPTEVELRAERMKKELRWTSDEAGWDIIKPDAPVAWDERFRGVLNIFVQPSHEREAEFRAHAETILRRVKEREQEQEQA